VTRVLFVGQAPEMVDFSDPALPPGFDAEKIQVGIDLAATNAPGSAIAFNTRPEDTAAAAARWL
jgi:hypothetical protein